MLAGSARRRGRDETRRLRIGNEARAVSVRVKM